MNETPDLLPMLLDQADAHAFCLMDADGRIVEWSTGAAKLYGYEREEILRRSGAIIFTPEDRKRGIFEHETSVARAGGSMEDDRWMMRKDGSKVWVSGVLKAFRSPEGAVIGFSKIMRNRTDFKIQTDSLEATIHELEAKNDVKRRMFATFAHELRNPLAPVRNVAKLLRLKMKDDTDAAPLLDILDRQVAHLNKMIDDLLDATRIEQGKLRCEKVTTDIAVILRQVEENCHSMIEERQHQFWLHLPAAEILVHGDPVRLEQIFMNLMANAIKYTPNGGRIYLRATLDADAVVTVEDDGIGISPEALPKIFDLFTQEESLERRNDGGFGIGLALVKDLVRMHGGTVGVRSDGRNKGSIFTVRLPLLQQQDERVGRVV